MTDINTQVRPAAELPPGQVWVNGEICWIDYRGAYVPVSSVSTMDRLMDETVRKIVSYAVPLRAQIARFRQHSFDDFDQMIGLIEQEFGRKFRSTKGNKTIYSFDGLMKVSVKVADLIVFGPELQVAKGLLEECLAEWVAEAQHPKLSQAAMAAFDSDKEGNINRSRLMALLRWEVDDERWKQAMVAIRESMRVIGSKSYILIHTRPDREAAWTHVSLDAASS